MAHPLAPSIATGDVETVVGAPMSYWRTVAWRLRQDPTTIAAGSLLLLIALAAILSLISLSMWIAVIVCGRLLTFYRPGLCGPEGPGFLAYCIPQRH